MVHNVMNRNIYKGQGYSCPTPQTMKCETVARPLPTEALAGLPENLKLSHSPTLLFSEKMVLVIFAEDIFQQSRWSRKLLG